MNYNSIEEIIAAGITNTVELFNGSVDDAIYSTEIPEWVKYNGKSSGILYYSSNSWIGFENTSDMQVCYHQRDTRMYTARLEVGTLYNRYNFMRYYYKGTTTYSGSTVYEWEVLFFDTGDIMIHGITIPDISGNYYIKGAQQYTYTAPSLENPFVTFYSTDENNSTFSIDYDIIVIGKLHLLAQDTDNVIYTVENGEFVEVPEQSLVPEVFISYGASIDTIQPILHTMPNLKLYGWSETERLIPDGLLVRAIPYNQVVYSDNLYRPKLGEFVTVLGIESVEAVWEGNPLVAVSFDAGQTWNAFKSNAWVLLEQENSGNTFDEIVSISTPAWNSKFDVARQIKFRFTLTEGDSVTHIIVNYLNPA